MFISFFVNPTCLRVLFFLFHLQLLPGQYYVATIHLHNEVKVVLSGINEIISRYLSVTSKYEMYVFMPTMYL